MLLIDLELLTGFERQLGSPRCQSHPLGVHLPRGVQPVRRDQRKIIRRLPAGGRHVDVAGALLLRLLPVEVVEGIDRRSNGFPVAPSAYGVTLQSGIESTSTRLGSPPANVMACSSSPANSCW